VEIDELTPEEELALVGLLREIVQADGEYSDQERKAIQIVRNELGPKRFDETIGRCRDQFKSRGDLKEHAKGIKRQEARELIFQVLEKVAEVDGLDDEEKKPLKWLASWWNIPR
jgi:uncharacterized tellurite resistance protein B-like protein